MLRAILRDAAPLIQLRSYPSTLTTFNTLRILHVDIFPRFASSHPIQDGTARRDAFHDFKRCIVRGKAGSAAAAYQSYLLHGGAPARHMIHSLMDLYRRAGDPDLAEVLLRGLVHDGPPPNEYSYGYVISALKRAAFTSKKGRKDPQACARRAVALYDEMVQRGIAPNNTVANETMDCLGKAGLVDEAFAFYERSIMQGVAPSLHTFSILIKACAVAQQPERGHAVVEKLMPAHGIEPTVATWNNLLAASEGMDGTYATWQRMVASKIVPDIHTERQLAKTFASNPHMALELVMEARKLSSSFSPPKTGPTARYAGKMNSDTSTGYAAKQVTTSIPLAAAASRQAPIQVDQTSDSQMNDAPAVFEKYLEPLDLHGHSQAAARMALLRRLEMLVEASAAVELCMASRTKMDKNLVVITGVGHGSAEGVGVLKDTVREVLRAQGLQAYDVEGNPGRLEITWNQLETFLATQRQQMERDSILGMARARYLGVATAVAAIGAAAFIVPRIMP